ncbi:39S ribosomal protein L22, mitochondrial [Galendromus occidentalis]|uniref:Large ribosomal subunit protein uL22m n=1 Tax=Galendromus occidentalis TaxID=34638 RepID=A0AAJ6QMU2_9ACAR|nr:39S ribosomal protein L22, mitochondrial [Galendromus occidentalis]
MLHMLAKPIELAARSLHTSSRVLASKKNEFGISLNPKWTRVNEKVHPPEQPVTPYVQYARTDVRGGVKKYLPLVWKIRGLSIDDAIAQMDFDVHKAAKEVKKALEEARRIAVSEHNIEYGSNMWVAEATVSKGTHFKGVRRHSRARYGEIAYKFSSVQIRLEEGKPPKHYYVPDLTPEQKLQQFKMELDRRFVEYSI